MKRHTQVMVPDPDAGTFDMHLPDMMVSLHYAPASGLRRAAVSIHFKGRYVNEFVSLPLADLVENKDGPIVALFQALAKRIM